MTEKNMWMVRAESGGILFDEFKTKSVVAIGWWQVGDLSKVKDRQELQEKLLEALPEYGEKKAIMAASQLYRFAHAMKKGDRVLTYHPSRRVYLVGIIVSEYEYDPKVSFDVDMDNRWPNLRKVDWAGEVSRDALSVSTKNSLGAISTLFQVPEEAAQEVEAALKGKEVPVKKKEYKAEEEEDLLEGIQYRANEFIKDRVSALDWDEMQELVAGLLRAMGYKTRVSPSGPDRGKDIVASPDGFGFESPRIMVEVKHRKNQQMGSQEIRSFLGGRHRDDKGLYVSTGGFSREAYYEAERANIPLTLMNLDDLVTAILEHYERMDIDSQRLVPLKKLYWPT